MFSPYAYVRMRALKDLKPACRARTMLASSHASPCSGKTLTLPVHHACGCASPFRARFRSMLFGESARYWRYCSCLCYSAFHHWLDRCTPTFPPAPGHLPRPCARVQKRKRGWVGGGMGRECACARLAGCGAHVAYAPRLRLRQAFSRMLWSQNSKR